VPDRPERHDDVRGYCWPDIDLAARTPTVNQQMTTVGTTRSSGEPKTARGFAIISLDPGTVDTFRDHASGRADVLIEAASR
jgi:hypothetical protein